MSGALHYRFTARFASLDLAVERWEVNRSRTVIVHQPARGRGATLSDRGRGPRTDVWTVRPVGDAATITATRDALAALSAVDEAKLLEHPIDGRWQARLTEFHETTDSNGVVFTLTLVEDRAAEARTQAAIEEDTGSRHKVEASVGIYEERRVALAASMPTVGDSLVTAETLLGPIDQWEESYADQIELDLEASRGRVSSSLGALDPLLDADAHETAIALLQAAAAIEQYAGSLRHFAARLAEIEVPFDRPLIRILTDLYGARQARELLDDVIRTNSITNPLRIHAGTVLRLPPL